MLAPLQIHGHIFCLQIFPMCMNQLMHTTLLQCYLTGLEQSFRKGGYRDVLILYISVYIYHYNAASFITEPHMMHPSGCAHYCSGHAEGMLDDQGLEMCPEV
jgi:hypothetical protein